MKADKLSQGIVVLYELLKKSKDNFRRNNGKKGYPKTAVAATFRVQTITDFTSSDHSSPAPATVCSVPDLSSLHSLTGTPLFDLNQHNPPIHPLTHALTQLTDYSTLLSAPVPAVDGGTSGPNTSPPTPLNGKKLTSHSSPSPATLPQTAFMRPNISGPGVPEPTRCISKCSRNPNKFAKTGVCSTPPLSVVRPLLAVLPDLTLPPSPPLPLVCMWLKPEPSQPRDWPSAQQKIQLSDG